SWPLVVLIHEDAMASAFAIQLQAANHVRLVPALEELKSKEPPVLPSELPEFGEIVEARVIERKTRWRRCPAPLANFRFEVQHPLLNCINGKFAAINTDPAAMQLLGNSAGRAGTREGVKYKVPSVR